MKSYYLPPKGFFIFGFEIRFYGVIIAVAMLLGILLACKLAQKKGIKSDDILLLAIICLPLAIVGARLYYCLFYEESYTFLQLFNLKNGGLAIYGGVIGGLIGVLIFCLVKKDFKILGAICDVCVPCLLLGQAIGRWGNFFNQEAYGNLITNPNLQWFPFAVFIEAKNAWFQATFFYESLWNLIGTAVLLVVFHKSHFNWTTSSIYLIWYGIGRAMIEGLRSDSLYIGGSSIRVSQALSVVLIIIGCAILVYNLIRRKKESNDQKI